MESTCILSGERVLISSEYIAKTLSDPNEPDYYKVARIILNLCRHQLAPKQTWQTITGEKGTSVEWSRCQYQACNRDLFICKFAKGDGPAPKHIKHPPWKGKHRLDESPFYYLIEQRQGYEATLCILGYDETDERINPKQSQPYRTYRTYVSIPVLLRGDEEITIQDNKYLCGKYSIMR